MRFLRTNTATRISIGPFLDKADGVTPKTALTVTNCKLTMTVDDGGVPTLVLDTNPTASGGANDMVHITGDDAGMYDLELAAANVNFLGRAKVIITDAANHCPVWEDFMILPAMVYDSLVLGTDRLDANVTHIADQSQTARDIGASVLLSSGTGTGQVDLSSGKVLLQATQTGVTIPTVTTLTNAPSDSSGVTTLLSRLSALRAGYLDNLSAGAAALESSIQSLITTVGVAGAGLTATASAVWSVATRLLTAGTNIVLAKGTGVTGFNDLSAAQVNAEVDTALADYDGPTHAELTSGLASTEGVILAAIPSVAAVENAVWNADATGHQTQGTFGQAIGDPVADTNTLFKAVVTDATGANIAIDILDLPTNAELATSQAAADDATLTAIGALNNLSQTDVRSAVGLGSANLDTQLGAIDTKTTNLPSDPADQSLVIAATDAIAARLPAALVSGRMDSSVGAIAANAITDAAVATDMDSYAAKMWIIRQSTTADQYGVTFYKNGQPLESGITDPLIDYVKKLSDNSILVDDATLVDEDDGDYYYGETTNKLVAGNAYMMRVTATIDGASRVFKQQIGRDSA